MNAVPEKAAVLVSVIIPVYNTESAYFDACLTSLEKQGLAVGQVEACIVFDGKPRQTLLDIAQEHERALTVSIYVNEHKGVAAARNVGLRTARGEWLAFVDSDDALAEGALAAMVDFASANCCELVLGNHANISPNGFTEVHEHAACDAAPTPELLHQMKHDVLKAQKALGLVWGKLFSSEFLRSNRLRFREDLLKGSDVEWVFRVVQASPRFGVLAQVVYQYHRREASIVRTWRADYTERILHTMEAMCANVAALPDAAEYEVELSGCIVYHLQLVLVHYLCSDEASWSASKRRAEFDRILAEPLFQHAMATCNPSDFSAARRVALFALRHKLYALCRAIGYVRQRQLGSGVRAAKPAQRAEAQPPIASGGGGQPHSEVIPFVLYAPATCQRACA